MFGLVELGELARKAAAVDAASASDAQLLRAAEGLAAVRSSLAAVEAHVLAAVDGRALAEREAGLSTGAWWARLAGLPSSVARSEVATARALRDDLPVVDEALAEGRVSADHARVLSQACNPRIRVPFAALQHELVHLAQVAPFGRWRREVLGIADRLDQDGGYDPSTDESRNRLSVVPTVEGSTLLSGTFVGEWGVVARAAIEAVADELFRSYTADHERDRDLKVPTRQTLLALALVELCRRGQAVDLHSTVGPRPDVTLVVQASDPDRAVTVDGVRLADGTCRTLLCDPDITALVLDGLGVPLDLGRRTRLASPAQRRALAVRDGGCVFPGCGAPPAWTDAHHIVPHRLGGRTDLHNLVSLCRRHHGVTHRRGWALHRDPDGGYAWTTPSGRTLRTRTPRPTVDARPP